MSLDKCRRYGRNLKCLSSRKHLSYRTSDNEAEFVKINLTKDLRGEYLSNHFLATRCDLKLFTNFRTKGCD